MNDLDNSAPPRKPNVPVIVVDNTRERQAWEAYQAICFAERAKPYLRENPYWTMHRNAVWQDWFALFQVL